MAIYKVIQDVEAEDTLIGPLTLRQLIYAAIAALACYASFLAVAKGAPFLIVFFLPFIAFGVFFAFPWSKQQPTEVWALAKVRFYLKPRRRIWDQSGAAELVSITAPKKVEHPRTNGLSQTEVKSRLQALADTIDTRGWAVKNVGVNIYNQQGSGPYDTTDRLVSASSLPQEVPNYDTTAVVDMLDARANPLAQQLDQMMSASSNAQRQRIVQQLDQTGTDQQASTPVQPMPMQSGAMSVQPPAMQQSNSQTTPAADYRFLNSPDPTAMQPGQTPYSPVSAAPPVPVAAMSTPDEEALIQSIKSQHAQTPVSYGHLRTLQPLSAQTQIPPQQTPAPIQQPMPEMQLPPVTPALNRATIELANNNDLTVAAMAHEAQRLNADSPDEVIVSLH